VKLPEPPKRSLLRMRRESPEEYRFFKALLRGILDSQPDKIKHLSLALGVSRKMVYETIELGIDTGIFKILQGDAGDGEGFYLGMFNFSSGEYVAM